MIQVMWKRRMFVPSQPRIGSFWATMVIGPASIDIIDYLLLLLILARTFAAAVSAWAIEICAVVG